MIESSYCTATTLNSLRSGLQQICSRFAAVLQLCELLPDNQCFSKCTLTFSTRHVVERTLKGQIVPGQIHARVYMHNFFWHGTALEGDLMAAAFLWVNYRILVWIECHWIPGVKYLVTCSSAFITEGEKKGTQKIFCIESAGIDVIGTQYGGGEPCAYIPPFTISAESASRQPGNKLNEKQKPARVQCKHSHIALNTTMLRKHLQEGH